MYAQPYSHQFFPIFEFRVFLEENGQGVLIAQYFCSDEPPDVGSLLDIRSFKERPEYPDEVKVLSVKELRLLPAGLEDQLVMFFVVAERV